MTQKNDLRQDTTAFQAPILGKSIVQVVTSFGGFFATCAVMYLANAVSVWLALALAPLAAGFLVRIFIIQHDCGHMAFFRGRRANDVLGFACSLLTLAPYRSWRRQHAGHHGGWNDLDRRDRGADIYSSCLTVAEYRALPSWRRLWYRTTRHPIVANVLVPPLVFIGLYRFPFDTPKAWRQERRAVFVTDLALVAMFGGLGLLLGFGAVAAVQIPVMIAASIIGVFLFSVQHRGDTVVWARHKDWDSISASLQSSSYLRLPAGLQWFTGNIGFHHVHHLNLRIPNYRLQECHEAIPALRGVVPLSLGDGFRAVRSVLWDEESGRMVTLRQTDAIRHGDRA
ncbi:fatty acid desaturase [Roseospira marina]|uniref:Fatty acid desaturase n=1 Tax=Roseospira marina TaxID=140057 RepID=A0A5M6I6W2_9PROT|nr:fatty acid desaturase [Roseospira marina]KAA5604000.1 fatty acid desaturase [Roseospira marina]MBB4315898.1 omega-6 fatty acid desaturase (delta-12 desaturase) [Roseospira marina]MBB5089056.1 omega-6 fatty acid desaturase (delta-12 desaturase) [Roseospira marina]